MSNKRILVVANTYEIGQRDWYDFTSEWVCKELESFPEYCTNFPGDPWVEVDGQELRVLEICTYVPDDGQQFCMVRCTCGDSGDGKEEYQKLLEAGWVKETEKFRSPKVSRRTERALDRSELISRLATERKLSTATLGGI